MVFSSPIFVFLFLPLTICLYFSVPLRAKNLLLLLASIIFYSWGEQTFFLVMLGSMIMNWVFGLLLDRFRERITAHAIMAGAIILNIGLLGFYKYSGFLAEQYQAVAGVIGLPAISYDPPHLPLGISFFTFHALSYVIDVFRRDAEAQRNPIDFALYISFFPQLVAGPIIRYHDICNQLKKRQFKFDLAVSGAERFVAGFGKKMLLANPLGEVADAVFALPSGQLHTSIAWLGICCYTLQIFLDFSAYSDMAIGLARIFGFNFLENFNYPYLSRSLQEFWRRWHISLSNWFRDYLYIPLGGNRVPEWRAWLNLTAVFLICGFWHGANWTFVIWGAFHGVFLVAERAGLGETLQRWPAPLARLYTLLVVVVAWVFFRAPTASAAGAYLASLAGLGTVGEDALTFDQVIDRQTLLCLVLGASAAAGLFTRLTSDWICRSGQARGVLNPPIESLRIDADGQAAMTIRFIILVAIALFASARMAAGTYNPFIYFRF